MSALPTIVHLDADAFFVACEQARDPSLRGTCCAVGGSERGIISSASYEARARGVYTPMPTSRARRVCPELILIPPTAGLYGQVSRRMFDLCETLTPLVQRNSIDEGYLDVGPCGGRSGAEIETMVRGLQARLAAELAIPVSLGLAANRLVAQIASKLRKPRGFVVVPPGQEAAFLAPLPLGKLPGIGAKTEAALAARGLRRVEDLFARSDDELRSIFGSGWRGVLAQARGEDDRPVETAAGDAKSYSQQETFAADLADFAAVERTAQGMLDALMAKVRADGRRVRTLTVRVRYPDFSHATHARSLEAATDVEAPFQPLIAPLLRAAWTRREPLRLVGVRLSGVGEGADQLELFAEGDERRRRLAGAVDRLNRGSPGAVVTRGRQLPQADKKI